MANIEKRARKLSFGKGLAIYALVLLLLGAAALAVFYHYMDLYEQTRPAKIARDYVQSLTVDDLMEKDEALLSSLDSHIQSREEVRAFLSEALPELSYARHFDGSDQEGYVYALEYQGELVGRFTLTETGQESMGLAQLRVSQVSFDWSPFCHEAEFVVPEDYTVSCNGVVLDESYITQTGVHYSLLEEFYDGRYELPTLVSYRSGRYIGDVETAVLDENGQVLDPAVVGEKLYADNCTYDEKEAITAFTEEYISRYVQYSSSAQIWAIVGYYRVIELVVPNSDLSSRLEQAIPGLGYASSKSDEIQSITIHEIMNVGNGYYVCDVTYLVETLGQADYVTTTNNAKLVLVQTPYGFLVDAQVSY